MGSIAQTSQAKLKRTHEGTIDWNEIRAHIAQASEALAGLNENTPEVMERIWAKRAARLAQVPAQTEESEQLPITLLRLGREIYGVEAQYVYDIRPVEKMTRVPRVPAWVAGVVNLRGRIFSVVDLQKMLGLEEGAEQAAPADSPSARSFVVVMTNEMELALLVDEALPMEMISVNKIQEAGGTVRKIRSEFMRGIADRSDDRSIVVLDLPALLADKQLIIEEEVV